MLLKNINSQNANNIINKTKTSNILVYYYASWCGYCQAFSTEWNKINKHITDNNICDVAEIESDELQHVKPLQSHFKGFPSLVLYTKSEIIKPKNNNGLLNMFMMNTNNGPKLPKNAIKYDGERTLASVVEFLNKHLNTPESTNNKVNATINNKLNTPKAKLTKRKQFKATPLIKRNKMNKNKKRPTPTVRQTKTKKGIKPKNIKKSIAPRYKNKGKGVGKVNYADINPNGYNNRTTLNDTNTVSRSESEDETKYTKKEIEKMKKERAKNSDIVSKLKQELKSESLKL
jgi:thiol-disulfide isomerase/thioredoxin